jgi:hypothetical protein
METVTTLIAKEPQNVQFPNTCFTYSHIKYSLWKEVESKCVCVCEGGGGLWSGSNIEQVLLLLIHVCIVTVALEC